MEENIRLSLFNYCLLIILPSLSSVYGCGTSSPSFKDEKTGFIKSEDAVGTGDEIPSIQSAVPPTEKVDEEIVTEAQPEEVAAVNEHEDETNVSEIDVSETEPTGMDDTAYPQTTILEEDGKVITIVTNKDETNEIYETVTIKTAQRELSQVDILWIVDNSGSMAEEQAYLSQNFDAFIAEIVAQPVDFQVAVTTTDICQEQTPAELEMRYCPSPAGSKPSGTHDQGKFRGLVGEQVLSGNSLNLLSKFSEYVTVGTRGSGFEHGLKAADLALEKVIQGSNDPLLRDDAFLAIIVVSDEEDDGIGLSHLDAYTNKNYWDEGLTRFRFTEDDLIDSLRSLKGDGKFSISTIAPTRNPDGFLCSAPHSNPAEEGTQYLKAAEKTGGVSQSICESNWNDSLAKIGLDLTAQISQITLEGIPDVQTIQVKVDDEVCTTWQYIEGNNAIKFDPNQLPPPGSQILIHYYKAH